MPEPRLTFIVDAKNLASREFKDLKRDLNSVERDAAKAGGGALGMAKALGPAKIAMIGLGVAGAGLALIAPMLGDTVEAASALNETLSKSKVVFGSAARGVEDFGDDAALSLGISKQAAVEAAATFGNLFVGLKLGEKPAADMSTRLVTLAGDLASFNNLDPTEVLEKLRSGLAGEAEPLRSLGVFLNEAKVKAKAMELGLADAHGELTDGAKVQARYALILEETTTAQGDFARTSDGLANKQRIANARMADASAVLGQKLLPVQLALTEALIVAAPALEVVADLLGTIAETAGWAAGAVGGFIGELQKLPPVAENLAGREMFGDILDRARRLEEIAGSVQRSIGGIDGRRASASLRGLGGALGDVTDDAEDTEKQTEALKLAFERAEAAARGLDTALEDLSGEMFGAEIIAGRVAEEQRQLADLLAEEPARSDAGAWTIWRGEVAASEQALFELQMEMAKQEGPRAFYDWIVAQSAALSGADAKAIAYYTHLRALAILSGAAKPPTISSYFVPLPSATGAQAFAEGGPVRGDRPVIVGERGPEIWMPPRGGGYILPNDASRSGGFPAGLVPVSIPVILDGREVARVVDEHLYYWRAGAAR